MLKDNNANVYGLYEVMNKPVNGSGCNPTYGLLGSNKSTEERLKLFPKTGDILVNNIQKKLKKESTPVEILEEWEYKNDVQKLDEKYNYWNRIRT